MSERANEMAAVVGTLDPTTGVASGTFTFDEIDASKFDSVLFIIQTGGVSSSGSAVATIIGLEGSSTGAVTTSINSVTHELESDAQYLYEIDTADLSGPNYRYVSAKFKADANASYSGVALGFKPRFHPASDNDLASVQVIKNSA